MVRSSLLLTACGLWRSRAHSRYQQWTDVEVAGIVAAMTGEDNAYVAVDAADGRPFAVQAARAVRLNQAALARGRGGRTGRGGRGAHGRYGDGYAGGGASRYRAGRGRSCCHGGGGAGCTGGGAGRGRGGGWRWGWCPVTFADFPAVRVAACRRWSLHAASTPLSHCAAGYGGRCVGDASANGSLGYKHGRHKWLCRRTHAAWRVREALTRLFPHTHWAFDLWRLGHFLSFHVGCGSVRVWKDFFGNSKT